MFKQCRQTAYVVVIFALCLLTTGTVAGAAGLLTPTGSGLPALDILDHKVRVVLEDGYAITTVDQVFDNPHATDLEAIYSFPVPEQGAVSEFTVWIDGKPVTGEVFEKKEARKIYEEEKAAGRDAGLAEKDEYKTFDIHVSPVRAGKQTRIRLSYLQPLDIDLGVGRYVYPLEEGGVDEDKLAFWTANEKIKGTFSFDLVLRSAYPVDALRLPAHPQAAIQQLSPEEWSVSMGASGPSVSGTLGDETPAVPENWVPVAGKEAKAIPQEGVSLNKDIVVYWRHQPGLPGSVDLVTHRPDPSKPGTFMLVVTPGDDLKPIVQGRDFVFVLDLSGSMDGKYATLVEGVHKAFTRMRQGDRFRIVLFNDKAWELTPGYVTLSQQTIDQYTNELINTRPHNGTNLYAGLNLGLSAIDTDRTSSLVLVTDGVANVGETEQRQFLKLLAQKDVRLFTFVMGNSANRLLLEAMAKTSNGFAINVSNSDDIVGKLLQATGKVGYEALHGVKLDVSGIRVSDMTPAEIGSLYRGQQLVLFGHYNSHGAAMVRLKGRISGSEKVYETRFDFPESSNRNPEIERLWAFAKIEDIVQQRDMFGEDADMTQAAVDLAVQYGLVTDDTSMVVMREEQFAARNVKRLNAKRLATEEAAQQIRAQAPVQSNHVDTAQPMYKSNRPTLNSGGGSGGSRGSGAFGPWGMALLVPLAFVRLARKRR